MEIYQKKFHGIEVSIIFTGKNYFFHSQFYGFVCIAERTSCITEIHNKDFVLYGGNSMYAEGFEKDWFNFAKRFICQQESKYVKTNCTFVEEVRDLNRCCVEVSYKLPEK